MDRENDNDWLNNGFEYQQDTSIKGRLFYKAALYDRKCVTRRSDDNVIHKMYSQDHSCIDQSFGHINISLWWVRIIWGMIVDDNDAACISDNCWFEDFPRMCNAFADAAHADDMMGDNLISCIEIQSDQHLPVWKSQGFERC